MLFYILDSEGSRNNRVTRSVGNEDDKSADYQSSPNVLPSFQAKFTKSVFRPENCTTVKAQIGSTASLPCIISGSKDGTVNIELDSQYEKKISS